MPSAGKNERTNIKVAAERAVLAAVHLPGSRFDPSDPLGELRSLARTAGAEVVGELTQNRHKPESGTFMGRGKLEELKALCDGVEASAVIFDHDLSPSQISNIEKVVHRKILDRSELILDIFASRATTSEAKLQVELAQLEYTFPRLRAMWDHLERIVGAGGIAGMGARGPGEQQLEIDRRIVRKRLTELRRELSTIQGRRRREVQKRNLDFFTVGLVGYTNAGKSTLFNTLTTGGAFVADKLFATLTTRTREWDVGGGVRVMLSDTVGFVRDLPHNLVASFRATLEEATHADLLLIVLDVSDPSADLHHSTVNSTLESLFEDVRKAEKDEGRDWSPPPVLLLLNKTDKLTDNASLLVWKTNHPDAIPIVAAKPEGPGHAELRAVVRAAAVGDVREMLITIPTSDSRSINTIEKRTEVLDRSYDNGQVTIRTRIGDRQIEQLRSAGAQFEAQTA